MGNNRVTNVVFAGLGGQGVLRASDIMVEAAFRAGLDVKKSEIHGMSQRGVSGRRAFCGEAPVYKACAPSRKALAYHKAGPQG